MEYLSVKELAAKFAMPERTVYHNIANHANIRTKKQGRSKFANVADFAKACGIELQSLQEGLQTKAKTLVEKPIASSQFELQKLQNTMNQMKEENLRIQKYNSNLEKQRNDYVLAFNEEKSEKRELMTKYDELQNKYHSKIEFFTKRYYLALGLCFALFILFLINLTSDLLTLF